MKLYIYCIIVTHWSLCSCNNYCEFSLNFIDVSNTFTNITSTCTPSTDHTFRCSNIWSALQLTLNDTCIRIYDNQILNRNVKLENIKNLVVEKQLHISGNITIKCQNLDVTVGVQIFNSSNITISNLNFYLCGSKQASTSSSPSSPPGIPTPYIATTLYFKEVRSVKLVKVNISASFGYGVVLYDVGDIYFNNVNVVDGTKVDFIYAREMF